MAGYGSVSDLVGSTFADQTPFSNTRLEAIAPHIICDIFSSTCSYKCVDNFDMFSKIVNNLLTAKMTLLLHYKKLTSVLGVYCVTSQGEPLF